MDIIDVEAYKFTRAISAIERFEGKEPEQVEFASAQKLAAFLANDIDESSFVQNGIDKKLLGDPTYRAGKKCRQLLKFLPHFRAYRKVNRQVNDAIIHWMNGQEPNKKYRNTIIGLIGEINNSRTNVSRNQRVFYGTGCTSGLTAGDRFKVPYFLSTSLSLTVAVNHSFRKSAGPPPDCRLARQPTVIAIRLSQDTRTIFAPTGKPAEHELLFNCGANIRVDQVLTWNCRKFDYVEATLESIEPPDVLGC